MARTPSKMIELGTVAPDFKLPDTKDGMLKKKDELFGKNKLL